MALEARDHHEALVQKCGRWQRQSADAFCCPRRPGSNDSDPLYTERSGSSEPQCWCKSDLDPHSRTRRFSTEMVSTSADAIATTTARFDRRSSDQLDANDDEQYFESDAEGHIEADDFGDEVNDIEDDDDDPQKFCTFAGCPSSASGHSRPVKTDRAPPVVSISRRRILSRLNSQDVDSTICPHHDTNDLQPQLSKQAPAPYLGAGRLYNPNILRRATSQPAFVRIGSQEADDFDEQQLFADQYGGSEELNADLNGNFRQMNLNSDASSKLKSNNKSVGAAKSKDMTRNIAKRGQIMRAPVEKGALNKLKSGSAGTSISCSSESSDLSAVGSDSSPIEDCNRSAAAVYRATTQPVKLTDVHKKSRKCGPNEVFSRKQTVEQWASTGKWNQDAALLSPVEPTDPNGTRIIEPELIEADLMQSELYNSEHSASISQLKEITNLANNQVVLAADPADQNSWHCKKRLYDDHIAEIVDKWSSLDSEIWCKVICMERNRRVAKAYIRLPYLIVTGASTGFDGYTIGLSGFENSHRDTESAYIVQHLDKGVRIKMDESGNLLMRRMCSASVQIKDWLRQLTEGEGSLGDEVIALHGRLPLDRAVKVFDMTRFERNLHFELNKSDANVRRLSEQCILPIAFGKNTFNLLNSPCWLMAINVIALRMISHAMHVRIPEPDYFGDSCSDVRPDSEAILNSEAAAEVKTASCQEINERKSAKEEQKKEQPKQVTGIEKKPVKHADSFSGISGESKRVTGHEPGQSRSTDSSKLNAIKTVITTMTQSDDSTHIYNSI